MAVDLYEEFVDLRIATLDPLPIVPGHANAGYPFPSLRLNGSIETRAFRAIVLENPYLRASFFPELGGRLLRLLDKRANREFIPIPDVLQPTDGGVRGVHLPTGVQLTLNGEERPNSMGSVPYAVEHDEDEAAVTFAEAAMNQGLSWHLRISIPPDRATLTFAGTFLNRTFEPIPYRPGLASSTPFATFAEANSATWTRFDQDAQLSPRQVDTWMATLVVHPDIEIPATTSVHGAMSVGTNELVLQPTWAIGAARVVLAEASGANHEASVQLYAEQASRLPLGSLQPVAVAVLDSGGNPLAEWNPSRQTPKKQAAEPYAIPADPDLEALTYDVARRAVAHTLLGIRQLKDRDYQAADCHFEKALNYNAEDPLLWWIKGVTRNLIDPDEDRPEIPNAHFLAPLEPVLRAEAFLSQTDEGTEPGALLASMPPEDLIEVAALLIEHGLLERANTWIATALRHRNLAMLHVLQAYILLQSTRMEIEAIGSIAAAKNADLPPYPWREVELEALTFLAQRLPADQKLQQLLSLCQSQAK